MENVYVKSVFCWMNKPLMSDKYPGGIFEIPPFEGSPGDAAFIMFMEQRPGPGRGRREKVGGWEKNQELSLWEALAEPECKGLALVFKDRLISLVRAYLENGVLNVG